MADNPLIKIRHRLKYQEKYDDYTIQMKHRRNWWWLLLLLLPLLLLIQCKKDIEVTCIDGEFNIPVADQTVGLTYTSHALWANGALLNDTLIEQSQVTDSLGKAYFKDLPCSVYSYIFYCLQKATFTAESECFEKVAEERNFHYNRSIELVMPPHREDLQVQLRDLETNDPLPDGTLIYKYTEGGEEKVDSAKADAAGVVLLPQMRYCGVIDMLIGKCYGYADTTKTQMPCRNLITLNDSSTLRLRPIKERFTFFVKNVETKQPIAGALCEVKLTHPGESKKTIVRNVTTSVDGKGIAVFENAFILSKLEIKASKPHFNDSVLTGGPWTVENFIKQDDDTRTIWLRPEPYVQEFVNIDSITLKPIPGVRNIITVVSPNGESKSYQETSNSNGVFPVAAKEDDRIEIISQKPNYYKEKRSTFAKFIDIKPEEKKIKMQPLMETLQFRTVLAENTTDLLPDCTLRITGSISGSLQPTNSGSGVFKVTMRKAEELTIIASKKGYITNDTKVVNRTWDYLRASQDRRDIPLKIDLPPCSGGKNTPKQANEMYHQRSYGMGKMSGNASITGDFYGVVDYLTVYDGPDTSGKILVGPDKEIPDKFRIPFHFTKGAVTVVIRTSGNNSSWEYVVNCPD
ncbi:MAG: hypothetical protein II200_07120 [Bacteroidaceae bacterium]|nr:hypothetical protein [Bacteroidaceae bacterium]